MSTLATGQITIIDLNDSVTLQGYLSSSQPKIQFLATDGSTYTPNWATSPNVVLTPELYRMGSGDNLIGTAQVEAIRWFFRLNGGALTAIEAGTAGFTLGANNGTLTMTTNRMNASNPGLTITCEIDYKHNSALPKLTYKLEIDYGLTRQGATGSAGNDAYTILSSNENHTYPADVAGTIPVGGLAAATVITALKGITAQNVTVGTITNPTGMTHAITNNNSASVTVTFTASAGATLADNGVVTIPLTVDNRNFSKTFSWSKTKNGATPTSYWLIIDQGAILRLKNGTLSPSSIVARAKSQTGTAAVTDFLGRFVIAESTNGGTSFVDTYTTPTTNESSRTQAIANAGTVTHVRVRLHQPTVAPTLANMYDEEIIPVVTEGSDGVATITSYVWAPSGTTFKNSLATSPAPLTAEMKIFNGNTEVTSGPTYLWAYPDATVKNVNTTVATWASNTATKFKVASLANIEVGQTLIINNVNVGRVKAIDAVNIAVELESALPTTPANGNTVRSAFNATTGIGWFNISALPTAHKTGRFANETTATLTIHPDGVPSSRAFRCFATWNSVVHTDTIAFQDFTDPYQVDIISSNGDVFKNRMGTTDLVCVVYQNGQEIDSAGTLLNYTWSKHNADGTKHVGWSPALKVAGNSKTIVVTPSDVTDKATFFCDISRK